MKLKALILTLSTALFAACGGGGGAASIDTGAAVTPSTPEAAATNMAASFSAIGEFNDIAGGFGGGLGKASNRVVEKIRTQQAGGIAGAFCAQPRSVSDSKIVCDCKDGGTITISGNFASLDNIEDAEGGNFDYDLKISSSNCVEKDGDSVETSNGSISIAVKGSASSEGDVDMDITLSVNGVFSYEEAGVLVDKTEADLTMIMELSSDSAAMQEAVAAATTPEEQAEIDPDDFFQIFQSIDGAVSVLSQEDACTDGVYTFKTIEKLQFGGCAGYKAGELEINGVSYAFADSEVTMSGAVSGTYSCEDLPNPDAICEE